MEDIKLDEKACSEILINSVQVGQRKGSFAIKDASVIYKVIVFLKTQAKPKDYPELDKKSAYDTLIRAVVLANTKGSFSIEEAALIDRVVIELQALDLASAPPKETEEVPQDNGKGKKPDPEYRI